MMVDNAQKSSIPEYQLGTESNNSKVSKDLDQLDKILDKKWSPESNNYDKKVSSPKPGSSLPRYAFIQCYSFDSMEGGYINLVFVEK